MRARAGQWVIQEGEPGDRLFVIAEGQLQVSREGQTLGVLNPGVVMGELAILYNCTRYFLILPDLLMSGGVRYLIIWAILHRTASVQATTDCVLFCLDRAAFQMVLL